MPVCSYCRDEFESGWSNEFCSDECETRWIQQYGPDT